MEYVERDLIVPALQVMREHPDGIDTTSLIGVLTHMLEPTGHSAEIIRGRSDPHLNQTVRNLKSHNTLENLGVAQYDGGTWVITDEGRRYLQDMEPICTSLIEQGISQEKIRPRFKKDLRNIIIEEGALENRTDLQRERSERLRRHAVEKFKEVHGRVFCEACGFDFERIYGDVGRDCIEVHHHEPIHSMEMEGTRITLEEALGKVSLLCSNCHTIVHRRRNHMLTMEGSRESLANPRREQID